MRVIIDPALFLAVLASGSASSSPKRRDLAKADPDELEVDTSEDQTDPAPTPAGPAST